MANAQQSEINHPGIARYRGLRMVHSKHLKKGLSFKESCLICNPSYIRPEGRRNHHAPKSLVHEPWETAPQTQAEKAADVIRRLTDKPAHEEPKPGQLFDFSRCWRLAERRVPAEAIASLFGITLKQLATEVEKHYHYPLETMLARAPVELQADLWDACYRKARAGDSKFITLLDKWGLLHPEEQSVRSVSGGQSAGKNDLTGVSTEELRARLYERQAQMLQTIERKSRFADTTQLSPTLTVRDATPDEAATALEGGAWAPMTKDADQGPELQVEGDPIVTFAEEAEELLHDTSASAVVTVEKPVRGPVTYFPPQEIKP